VDTRGATTPEVLSRYLYRHYGLTLDVNERLAGMATASSPAADVTVEFLPPGQVLAPEQPWMATAPAIWRANVGGESWLRLRYDYGDAWAEFVIDGRGESVWISRDASVLLTEAAELLMGPIFSCLASQRGLTCIHASVVRLDSGVVALIGPSGAGKSTTALALVRSGGMLVSDDTAILSDRDERITVATGAARYVPTPRGAETIGDGALSLDVIYFLGSWSETGAGPSVRELTPASALPRLMAQRHMAQAIERGSDRRDFDRLARLLRIVPSRELIRPRGLETTEQTVAAIMSDVRDLV
jgi:hypothetical protein